MYNLPNASDYYAQCLSLPIHMGVSLNDVRQIVDSLSAIVGVTG